MSTCLTTLQRIGAIIKRKQKERRAEAARLAQKEAEGDYSHLKNKKGELIAQPLPQPTLPNLSVDDDDASSMNTRVAPSMHTKDYNYYNDKADYPPMPAYNAYGQYNPSSASVAYGDPNYPPPPQHLYDTDNESQIHLAAAACAICAGPCGPPGEPVLRPARCVPGARAVDAPAGVPTAARPGAGGTTTGTMRSSRRTERRRGREPVRPGAGAGADVRRGDGRVWEGPRRSSSVVLDLYRLFLFTISHRSFFSQFSLLFLPAGLWALYNNTVNDVPNEAFVD